MLKIGFIGLGLMGQGMAENLIKHKFSLTIMAHRNRAPVEALRELGADKWKISHWAQRAFLPARILD